MSKIPIKKVAEHLGISLHHSTIFRWYKKGIVVGGKRVRLKGTRYGNRIFVDEDDLHDFVSKLNGQDIEPSDCDLRSFDLDKSSVSPKANRQAEVDRALDELGL